jgi:hypothetical protein
MVRITSTLNTVFIKKRGGVSCQSRIYVVLLSSKKRRHILTLKSSAVKQITMALYNNDKFYNS